MHSGLDQVVERVDPLIRPGDAVADGGVKKHPVNRDTFAARFEAEPRKYRG